MKLKQMLTSENIQKRYWQVSTMVFLMAAPAQAFATTDIKDPVASAPTWLNKISGILTEPLGWLKWIAILYGVLRIAQNGLKYKDANGDPGEMKKAKDGMKAVAIGSFIVFSAAGIGSWFFGKLA
ncbi:hypothetical protein A8L34_28240 [Bacillus sp. FJAT-27264]|uniref:pilin n=1 Tax=Paenibacillus sp. (strain DSM 101736 / FJAT-27264) TaxID=1850362 RepID=UPI000807F00C|nr:pilin [Bacillus sp. FJAT-27264]OBZ15939.1 hypothetical protein A8L34_28240 [Bacillus sp. FJAT-27264]